MSILPISYYHLPLVPLEVELLERIFWIYLITIHFEIHFTLASLLLLGPMFPLRGTSIHLILNASDYYRASADPLSFS